jgi:AAA family ATP:ADP antiporter
LLGIGEIMILAAAVLLTCTVLTRAADSYERAQSPAQAEIAAQPISGDGAFRMVLTKRSLLQIAILIVLINMGNSTGEFMLSKMAVQHADIAAHGSSAAVKRQLIGAFYGSYFAWGSLVGLILQAVFVPRVLRGLGATRSLLVGPGVSALGYSLVALTPALPLAEAVKIAENSMDYSLGRTALNALFLRTSRAAKYKAKAVIDTFFYRSGDLLQSLLVMGGTRLALEVREFAVINILLALASAGLVLAIHREHVQSIAPRSEAVSERCHALQAANLLLRPLKS